MVRTYATLVQFGRRTFSSVPDSLKADVKKELQRRADEHVNGFTQEKLDELLKL